MAISENYRSTIVHTKNNDWQRSSVFRLSDHIFQCTLKHDGEPSDMEPKPWLQYSCDVYLKKSRKSDIAFVFWAPGNTVYLQVQQGCELWHFTDGSWIRTKNPLTTNQCCGSGSKLDPYSATLWIRIRIPKTDPDPHN